MKILGRVLKFGDNVNTTIMAPHEAWGGVERQVIKPMKEVTMTAIRPGFPEEVRRGDIIVAGKNWGCGSHRDEAVRVFIELGLKAILADTMADLYYRMCIAYGLPAFTCEGVSKMFKDGDQIEVDLSTGEVENHTTGEKMLGKPLPEFLLMLLEKGGLMPIIVEKNK